MPDCRVLFIDSVIHQAGTSVLRVKAIAIAKILQGHFTLYSDKDTKYVDVKTIIQ